MDVINEVRSWLRHSSVHHEEIKVLTSTWWNLLKNVLHYLLNDHRKTVKRKKVKKVDINTTEFYTTGAIYYSSKIFYAKTFALFLKITSFYKIKLVLLRNSIIVILSSLYDDMASIIIFLVYVLLKYCKLIKISTRFKFALSIKVFEVNW